MAKLNEFISRKANKEDDVPARVWEGRFKSTRLDDAAAILACMTYIDLNPVRAKMAEILQESEYTSAQARYVAELAKQRIAEYKKRRRAGEVLSERQESLRERGPRRLSPQLTRVPQHTGSPHASSRTIRIQESCDLVSRGPRVYAAMILAERPGSLRT